MRAARRVAGLAGLAVAVAMSWPLLAGAEHPALRDPRDAPGLLDLSRVRSGAGRTPGWTIATYARWTNRRLRDRGFFLVQLDTVGDGDPDYYALTRSTGGRLSARLFRHRRGKDRGVSRLGVGRPDRRTARVRVPLRKMRRRAGGTYSWYVETLWTSDRCPRVCFDRAPDRGAVSEPPSPLPTPSVSTPPAP